MGRPKETFMSHFAVVVTVNLKPGIADEFRSHILTNATASKRDESGCHRFDVLATEHDADTIIFYEEYTDAAAFDAHRETAHYKALREATDDMVLTKHIQRCHVIS
jgi:quinol monooxygenase YgiN